MGCASSQPLTKQVFLLDTIVTISIYGSNKDVLDQTIALCQKYHNMFNKADPDSEIAKINNAACAPVEVSPETVEVISTALKYCQACNGVFDITIGPLSDLWDFLSDNPVVPDAVTLAQAAKLVDYHCVEISGNTIRLTKPGAELDLGGIAKGYIADRLTEFLLSKGVTRAIINLGGNVVVLGEKANGVPWNVAIQAPFEASGTSSGIIKASNQSVVTSGVYQRYFRVDNKLYHHILDPKTGYPTDSGLYSATIISEKSVDGDALSTICLALGADKAVEFMKNYPDMKIVLITSDNNVISTAGDQFTESK